MMDNSGSNKGPGLMVAIGTEGKEDLTQDCVPASALAMPGDDEQMAEPEPGDKVQYTVEGTVVKIDGDCAVIKRESINGQPVNDNDEDDQPEPDADDEGGPSDNDADNYANLEKTASAMDQAGGMGM